MKKIITLVFSCVCLLSHPGANAQCTINYSITTPGFTPTSLPCIVLGQTYGQAFQFHLPSTVTVDNFTVDLDSVQIDSITGFPNGINYSVNPSTPVAGDSNGCVWIYGNASDTAGSYALTFYASIWAGHSSQPIDTSLNSAGFNYALNVCSPSFAACDSVLNYSSLDTPAYYREPDGNGVGYVTGNNTLYTPAGMAEELTAPPGSSITAVNIIFAYCTINPGDSDIALPIYIADNSGTGGAPGNVIDTTSITLRQIATGVAYIAGGEFDAIQIPFNVPVVTNGTFFAIINLPQNEGDTIAILSTTVFSPDGNGWENIGGPDVADWYWDPFSEDYVGLNNQQFNIGLYISAQVCTNLPVVSFSASPTSICYDKSVSFFDQSSNARATWSWTFDGGNPSSSNLENPIITYPSAGTYSVELLVSNIAGADSVIKTGYITVESGPVDSTVSLTPASNSTSNDGEIEVIGTDATPPYRYYWSTGDTSALLSSVSAGDYQLTVIDANGCYSIDDSIIIPVVSGLTAYGGLTGVKIYPNPAVDQLNIEMSSEVVADVEILDVAGNSVITAAAANAKVTPVDIRNLASGTYLLKIKGRTSGRSQTFMFTKVAR